MTTTPTSIPDLGGLPASNELLAILDSVARNTVYRRPGNNGNLGEDWMDTAGGGYRRVTPELKLMERAGWATRPPVTPAKHRAYWTPTMRGWRIRQYHGRGTPAVAVSRPNPVRLNLIPELDRIIPEWPTPLPPHWDQVTYRAAVFCESAAAIARRRPVSVACCGDGLARRCQSHAQALGVSPTEATWALCVYCALAAAREDFQTGYPRLSPAELCLSMTAAFEAVEGAGLHRKVPADQVAEALMVVARQLHHAALSPAALISRTG